MHGPDLSPIANPPVRRRRKRGRLAVNALAHEQLFLVLAQLRAANAASLFELYFKRAGIKWRTAMRRLKDLVADGYLAHLRLEDARCVYHLTPKSAALTPQLQTWSHSSLVTVPRDRQAMFSWLRSAMYAALTADGWTVGNDAMALYALRRSEVHRAQEEIAEMAIGPRLTGAKQLLEMMRASPALTVSEKDLALGHRWRCRACGAEGIDGAHRDRASKACSGALRAVPVTPLDIAWRKNGLHYDAMVLFVDNPSRPLDRQLEALRAVCFDITRVPVIARATDPTSRFDVSAEKWIRLGDRHTALNRALQGDGALNGKIKLVEYRSELQAYPAR